jgi:hypothetical protein
MTINVYICLAFMKECLSCNTRLHDCTVTSSEDIGRYPVRMEDGQIKKLDLIAHCAECDALNNFKDLGILPKHTMMLRFARIRAKSIEMAHA